MDKKLFAVPTWKLLRIEIEHIRPPFRRRMKITAPPSNQAAISPVAGLVDVLFSSSFLYL